MEKTTGKIVKEYLRKYSDLPSKQLSRMIYRENKSVFTNEEHVRSVIRYHSGAMGEKMRKKVNKEFIRPLRDTTYSMPKSDSEKRSAFVIPSGVRKLGVLSDIHLPYHDEQALSAAVNYLKESQVDAVLLNGDTLDFYGLSAFEKDPRKRRFSEEIECFKEFLNWIKQELNCPIYFKVGNHEYRYQRYMAQKAPELLDIPKFHLFEVLEFGALGVVPIESNQKIRAGKFTIYHGHEFRGSGGVNPARWLSLKAKISSAVGHFHKASEHVWRDSNDNTMVCYSFGCLCELSPDYLPENEWTQGCAVIHLEKNGDFHVENKKIINGRVY